MKKFLKVAGVVVLLLCVAAAGAGFYLWRSMGSAPDFYYRAPLAGSDRLAAIESFDRKVLNLQSALDLAYIHSISDPQQNPAEAGIPVSGSAGPVSVTFSAGELDTYFNKWLVDAGYEERVGRYMRDPRVGIQDGHVILAGRMQDFGAVVSLWFLPSVDEAGVATLQLTGVYAGRLPVPRTALDHFREMARQALTEDDPSLREQVEISSEGTANKEAVLVAVQRQLEQLVAGEPVKPLVVFLPLPTRGTVPARVGDLGVHGDELTLAVNLLDLAERQELAEDLRSGAGDAGAAGS